MNLGALPSCILTLQLKLARSTRRSPYVTECHERHRVQNGFAKIAVFDIQPYSTLAIGISNSIQHVGRKRIEEGELYYGCMLKLHVTEAWNTMQRLARPQSRFG